MISHRLFAKIFLWFWLAIIVVASAAATVSLWISTYDDPQIAHARHVARITQEVPAAVAVDIYETAGREALGDYLRSWTRGSSHASYLFDEQGEELAGQKPPRGSNQLIAAARVSGGIEIGETSVGRCAAVPVRGGDGRRYVFLARVPPPLPTAGPPPGPGGGIGAGPERRRPPPAGVPFGPFGIQLQKPHWLAILLLAVVVTGGGLCYWLARHLTGPIEKLRAATLRLADGDLAVRVGDSIGGRKDELAALGRDFDGMAERLQVLLESQRRLLRDISHELRSPLARMSIALGIARQQPTEKVGESLDRIERESERLNDLIGQLLTLVRLESGPDRQQAREIDLEALVHDAVADAQFEANSRRVDVRIGTTEPCQLIGDPELLRRAVENVIRNAVQYTAEGTSVEVDMARNGAELLVRVRDHGPGVPEHDLSEVFRPFYRVQSGRERSTGGVGLGLSITDRAVRAHGGSVSARNAEGGGLIVSIRLPTDRHGHVEKTEGRAG